LIRTRSEAFAIIQKYLKLLDSGFRRNDENGLFWGFYEFNKIDGIVKSQIWDGKVKSSRCKARKF